MNAQEIDKKLIAFARWAIAEHRATFSDLDGSGIQEKLEELGLLVQVPVQESCGEYCQCAEYVDEWPAMCQRLMDGVMAKGFKEER